MGQLWELLKEAIANELGKYGNGPKLADLLMRDKSTQGIRDYSSNVQQRGATLAGLLKGIEPTDQQKALFNISDPSTMQGAFDLAITFAPIGIGMIKTSGLSPYHQLKINHLEQDLKDSIEALNNGPYQYPNMNKNTLAFRVEALKDKLQSAKENPSSVFGEPNDLINYSVRKGEKFAITNERDAQLTDIHRNLEKYASKLGDVKSYDSNMSSSKYLELPNGIKIRISDHPIPKDFEQKFGKSDFNISNYDDAENVKNYIDSLIK